MSKIIFTEEGSKPPAPSAGQISMYVKTDEVVYIQDPAGNEIPLGTASGITSLTGEATATGPGAAAVTLSNSAVIGKVLTGFVAGPNSSVTASDSLLTALQKLQAQITAGGSAITALTGDVSATGPGSAAATVNSVGGSSATNIHSAELAANAATAMNTASTIVERDASGNFVANVVTANLNGNASTATSSTNFSGSLSGDVTGTQSTTVVTMVGGSTAASIHTAQLEVAAATATNLASTLVERDASGNFSANIITASLTGNVTGNVSGSAASFTGPLSGDVTGNQSSTSIAATTVTGKVLTGYSVGSNTPIAATDTILSAFEKTQAQINTTSSSAITALTGDATATGPGSVALTLATVNSNVGSFGTASSIPTITVNSKGLITAASNTTIAGLTNSNLSGTAGITGANIATNTINNSNLAQMAANTIKGNNTGITANAADLTTTQVTAMLNPFTGDTGTGGVQGLVPAPTAGQAEQGNFLEASGSFSFVDTSKPRYPSFQFLTSVPMPTGTIKDQSVVTYTYLNNTYAVVSGGNSVGTITIYNITDPASVQQRGAITLAGTYGASVYFSAGIPWAIIPSSGGSHLYTVNLSNPNSLSIGGNLLITGSPGSLYSAVASNGYVYISTQNQGLTVVDIGGGTGSLTAPVQVFQEGSVKSFGIALSGTTLYTTNYQTTFPATVRYLKTWSLSSPSTPSLQNTYTIPGGPTATSTKPGGISISGNTAIITDINQLVYDVIDITTPTSPSYLTYIVPSYNIGPGMIAQFSGNYIYLPSGSNAINGAAIDFIDLTNRSAPVKIASAYNGVPNAVGGGIALSNGYIYLADYGISPGSSGALDVFSNPAESFTAGSITASHVVLPGGDIQTQINALVAASGIERIITSISTPTTAGATALRDYVYLVSGTTTITLPTAVSNNNRYAIKNVGSGTVTINTTSAQTIDGSTTVSLPVKYTSLDLVSDGANWNVI